MRSMFEVSGGDDDDDREIMFDNDKRFLEMNDERSCSSFCPSHE